MKAAMMAPRDTALDEHYTVQELVALWKYSRRTVKRLVEKEPGVVRLGTERPGKRPHYTLRIPASVARRIYARLVGEIEGPAKMPPARVKSLVRRRSA
jgi:hypothetical protein